MAKVMEVLADITHGESYNTMKYSYESIGVPSFDYDDALRQVVKYNTNGETVRHAGYVDLRAKTKTVTGDKPILTFFLDGSRHVYKVDDMSFNKKVYPIVAGQIGIGCCKRVNKKMIPEDFIRRSVIVLPDKFNSDGWDQDAVFGNFRDQVNERASCKNLGFSFSEVLSYDTQKIEHGKLKDIENRGIATIQDYMIECEQELVKLLASKGCLNQDNYLVKDGSLEYKKENNRARNKDLCSFQKLIGNYNWVIGVSKKFNPESLQDHTGKPNAKYIADLPLFCRTPVAKYENLEFHGDTKFAVWYIRIRDRQHTFSPFDGVIKVEKILIGREQENSGLDSEVVDLISANLINERTPTCYGADARWANHLYPVYVTESYVKSKYMSDLMFLSLF